jgi:hypothetical protein
MNITGPELTQPIQKLDDNSLVLRNNQRITAEVLQISGDQVRLALDNTQVIARMLSPDQAAALQERRLAQFIVRENNGQTISLQLINPDSEQRSSGEPAPNLLINLLVQDGIPLEPGNVIIAQALLEANLPVTSDLIMDLKKALNELALTRQPAAWGPQEAQMAATLKSAGLPLTGTILALALGTPLPLQVLVSTIQNQLQKLGEDPPPDLAEQIEEALSILNGWVVDWSQPPGAISDQLQAVLRRMGRSIENELAETIERGLKLSTGGQAGSGLMELALIRQDIAKAGGNDTLVESFDLLFEALRRMLFSNVNAQSSQGKPRWFSFDVPIGTYPQAAQQGSSPIMDNTRLRVACQTDNARQHLDVGSTRIVVQLELEDGNALEVDLSVVERQVGASITSTSSELKSLAEAELPAFKDSLDKLGFAVLTARVQTGPLALATNLENQNRWKDFREINIAA